MKLADEQNLRFYEKLLQNREFDTFKKSKLKSPQFQLHFYSNQTVNSTHILFFYFRVIFSLKKKTIQFPLSVNL